MILNYIIWNPSEVLFQIGFFKVRWYSLMIIGAFLGGKQLLYYFFKKEGRPVEDVDRFSMYVLLSCLIGARLGEVIFYDPIRYLKNPLEAILPVRFTPHFQVVGYQGLSYHGALIGGVIGVLLYANYYIRFNLYPFQLKFTRQKKVGQSFLWLLTPLALGVHMGFLVRIGNFVNSEIIGTPTHNKYGVLFAKDVIQQVSYSSGAIQHIRLVKNTNNELMSTEYYPPVNLECTFGSLGLEEENVKKFIETKLNNYLHTNAFIKEHIYLPNNLPLDYVITKNKKSQYIAQIKAFAIPRHPVQLYESLSYLITLILLIGVWMKKQHSIPDGVLASLAAIISYSFRFFFEFFKDPFNVIIDGKYPITMGHILSLITVLIGITVYIYSYYTYRKKVYLT